MAGIVLNWNIMKLVKSICDRLLNRFDVFIIIEGNRGLGKTCVKGSKVLMSSGEWKNIEDIKINDEVISPQKNGSFTYEKVIETHNRFEKDVYEIREVTRQKRLLYTCAGNHEIPILRLSHPRIRDKTGKCTDKRLSKQVLDLWDAKKISQSYTDASHICSFSATAIEFKNKDCEINPYCLGVWLGDGHFSEKSGLGISLGSRKKEVADAIKEKYEVMSEFQEKGKDCKRYRFSKNGILANQLRKYNLKSGSKFIPKQCLLSSINYRLKLLAGLIDTDGYVMKNKDNCIIYTTKSKQLAEDIKNLVFSLGGNSNIREISKRCQNNFIGDYFNVKISFENPKIIPLKNEFKKLRLGNKMKHNPCHVAIESVKTKPQQVYGFGLTGNSKWYVTDNWMVTHNSTLAYKLMKLVKHEMKKRRVEGYRFSPRRDLLYSRREVLKFFNDRQRSGIADEMVNVSFSRDFYDEEQKDLIKMVNMNRDHCNFFIACIPHFKNLDTQIKGLTSMRITVVRRGIAIVQTPNKTIYSKDIWDETVNEKIERAWLLKGVQRPHYSKLTTFRGFLRFSKLTEKQETIYQKIKDKKRNIIIQDKGLADVDEKDPFTIIYNNLIEGKVKNSAMIEGMGLVHGMEGEYLKRKLRRELKKKNKHPHLTSYYYDDSKAKEKIVKEIKQNKLSAKIQLARSRM